MEQSDATDPYPSHAAVLLQSAAGGFMTPAMDTRATAPMVTAKMTAALAPELIAERDQVGSHTHVLMGVQAGRGQLLIAGGVQAAAPPTHAGKRVPSMRLPWLAQMRAAREVLPACR